MMMAMIFIFVVLQLDLSYCFQELICDIPQHSSKLFNGSGSFSFITPLVKTFSYSNDSQLYDFVSLSKSVRFRFSSISFAEIDVNKYALMFCSTGQAKLLLSERSLKGLYIDEIRVHENLSLLVEEYSISLSPLVATIHISSTQGLIYSLNTLDQLVDSPYPIQAPLLIRDWPENRWRGVMIDISRHYIPMPLIYRTIDGMVASKLNILHLHLVDSQAFPVLLQDIDDIPLSMLAREGSHKPDTPMSSNTPAYVAGSAKVYTLDQLHSVVVYANQRGIEVIPEIDVPSHALSWGIGDTFSDIIVKCPKFASRQQSPVNVHSLNPSSPRTLRVVRGVLEQVAAVFPSTFFHVGGDEVFLQCWEEDKRLVAWARSRQMSLRSVLKEFMFSIFDIVRSLGKIPITWQDLLDQGAHPDDIPSNNVPIYLNETSIDVDVHGVTSAPPGTTTSMRDDGSSGIRSVVQSWKCWDGLAGKAAGQAMKKGLHVATSACWYLDFNTDFDGYLEAKPIAALRKSGRGGGLASHLVETFVLGGEAAVWTEKIDESNFECRVWPRVSAIAYSLWGYQLQSALFSNQQLTAEEKGRYLYMNYIRFKYYLKKFGIVPSELVFHLPVEASSGEVRYSNVPVKSEEQAIQLLSNQQISISDTNELLSDIKITSQCPSIHETVQRPMCPGLCDVKMVQYNIREGGEGLENGVRRMDKLTEWLRLKANTGVTFIGLNELNGWHTIESDSDSSKNFPRIRSIAATAGFAFAHVMSSSHHPYNIGIISSIPFQVVGEYGPPTFQRGVLHVFFPSIQLHVFVVHLHAHQSQAREVEAQALSHLVSPLLLQVLSQKVVVMGDMNSLCEEDDVHHRHTNTSSILHQSNRPTIARLRQKFCDQHGNINYRPLQILKDIGLKDVCYEQCRSLHLTPVYEDGGGVEYAECVRHVCAPTIPTSLNPEWDENIPMPHLRLDYIFASDSVLSTNGHSSIVSAGVERNEMTSNLSDHFPVYFTCKYDIV